MTIDDRDARNERDGLDPRDDALMRRARAAFEAEAAALDPATTRRLAAARRAALAALDDAPSRIAPAWRAVGAAATVAGVAIALALAVRGHGAHHPMTADTTPNTAAPAASATPPAGDLSTEMELALDAEDLSLYGEDPQFVEWAVATTGDDDAPR